MKKKKVKKIKTRKPIAPPSIRHKSKKTIIESEIKRKLKETIKI